MSAKHYYFTFNIHKIPDHKPIETASNPAITN